MTPEDEGIAYLTALRRSGDAPAATPATPSLEANPDSLSDSDSSGLQPPFQGPEKRRSSRYKCEGSAEMREEGCEVRTWATFTDISLHGCYVEAQATYPVGTLLHLKLEANGLRIESQGNVRVNYPYLGMGIAFVDMSDENQMHLKQLLGVVSHPASIVAPALVSPLPSAGPLEGLPLVSDPGAALQMLVGFFEERHVLTREDFVMIVGKSQKPTNRH
jgi:hypothetical protein